VVTRTGRPPALAAAVIDGIELARGEIVVVMDADFSHPPERVPDLVRAVEAGAVVAVGSRYVPGGGVEDWPYSRQLVSRFACALTRPLTPVRDATSGFFAARREAVVGVDLSPHGFKIGLEVLIKGRHAGRVREVPYVFRDRLLGKSKFGPAAVLWFLRQLAALAIGRRSRRSR
jgi:dolichol-phosphate mannosyltransferase